MKVTWEIVDGYVGNGTHTTVIPDSDLEDLEGDELMEEIEEWVQDDFDTTASFTITHLNGKEV